jgi:predicted nucleotidyltransferase component of viral defense system
LSRRVAADIGASVRDRLKQKFPGFGYDFQVLLTHYALERLLYRLGRSKYRNQFLLKGALLFKVWYDQPVRSSMDADLLGEGPADIPKVEKIFRDLCRVSVEPDGLEFLADTVHGEEIRENSEYQGIRMTLAAVLAGARIHLQIDVGYGDAVSPQAKTINYPVLLDLPAPSVKAYTQYTVIAEKFQTIVDKGLANSRMKDYYDLWYISRHSEIDGAILAKAVTATFKRRKTELPSSLPEGLDKGFSSDPSKQRQWTSFLKKNRPREAQELIAAVAEIQGFLMPAVRSLIEKKQFHEVWRPGQGWRKAAR